jgi:pilus assembly protein CpaF
MVSATTRAFPGAGAMGSSPAPGVGSAPAAVDYALVRRLQARVADKLTEHRQTRERAGQEPLSPADEQQLALSLARDVVGEHARSEVYEGREPPDPSVDRVLVESIYAAIFGAGQLQTLLDDPDVENIDINGCDEVWVTYADGRGKVRERPVAASDEELVDIVRNLGAYSGITARPFSAVTPELDLRLSDGSRLSAIMGATERPAISIRRNRYPQMFLDAVPAYARPEQGKAQTLLELGSVDEQLAGFLRAAVLARANIMVAGATDAGKTTLLRALVNCIPPAERLITVERALELGLRRHRDLHADVVEMEEVLPSADGGGGLGIRELVRRTRRQNPSRVIVGEVLGPEVVEMLSAMSQGNDGSLSTIHARDAADVFSKLATYAAQYEGLSFEVSHSLMGASIDFVVFVRKNPLQDGRRQVMEVLEVTGAPDGRVSRAQIFGVGPDGRAVRDPEVQITRRARLADHGYDDGAYPPAYEGVGYGATGYGWRGRR